MELRLFRPPSAETPEFTPVATIYGASAIRTTDKFYTYGDFEIIIPARAANADKFEKYLFILIDRRFWGLILSIELTLNSSGEALRVGGLDLKGLTSARVTMPGDFSGVSGTAGYDIADGTTETCMKHFVHSNFFNDQSPTRSIPGFVIAPDLGRGIQADKFMSRHDLLSDVLMQLGEAAEIGYSITPDLKDGTIVFDCVTGVDRTAGQSENPRVIFSVERRNISGMEYKSNDRNMKNLFYATMSGAQFADESYTATYTREDAELPAGIRRWEQHLEISATHPTAGEEYNELKRLALIRAENYRTAESFECEVLNMSCALGDIVTLQNPEWGISKDARLTELTITADANQVARRAVFGNAPVNIFGRLKRQLRGG